MCSDKGLKYFDIVRIFNIDSAVWKETLEPDYVIRIVQKHI